MRPANKYERHQLEQRKQARRTEDNVRPSRMPSYSDWLKRQAHTTHAAPRDFLIDSDNLSGA